MVNLTNKTSYKYDEDVNSPAHYNTTSMETIDLIHNSMDTEGFHSYLKGNIIKYICRYQYKNAEDPLKDLLKARWYLEKLILSVDRSKNKDSFHEFVNDPTSSSSVNAFLRTHPVDHSGQGNNGKM